MKQYTHALVLFYLLLIIPHWPVLSQHKIPEDAIRLRIIAHSDHPLDQFIKQQVQIAVLNTLEGALAADEGAPYRKTVPTDTGVIEQTIRDHLSALRSAVDQELTRLGAAYGAELTFSTVDFPAKTYGPHVYPAGPQKTLLIVLGEGSGHNLWCVLLPQFCLPKESIKSSGHRASYTTDQRTWDDATQPLTEPALSSVKNDEKPGVTFRFWLWDWIRSLWS